MSRGINKVIIVGNLGNDPESRTFPDGGTVSNISVATSDAWRDRNTGEMQERTEWHRIVLRDRGNYRLGQIAQQYLRKGSKVYVEGSLRTRKYTDAQGQDRYITEVVADQLQMLDSRGAQDNMGGGYAPMNQGGYDPMPPQAAQPYGQQQQQGNYQQQATQQPYAQPAATQQTYQEPSYQQTAAPQQQAAPTPAAPPQTYQAPPAAAPSMEPSQPQPAPGFDEFDDDIPF